MGVTEDDVRAIAALARLKPDADAVARLTEELNGILDHVRALERLDLPGSGDAGPAFADPTRFREPDLPPDALREGAPAESAPRWEEGFFVVPRLPALDEDRLGGGGPA